MHHRRSSRCGAAFLVLASTGFLGCAHTSPDSDPAGAAPEERGGKEGDIAETETGAVSTVTAEDMEDVRAVRMEELLEGRVAGVQVIRTPDGGISVRIRGRSSFHGDNEPLYVVDGMPVNARPGRGVDWLNPGDIARIEVLKDASTTSMYGVRGANGVVLITTKRAR